MVDPKLNLNVFLTVFPNTNLTHFLSLLATTQIFFGKYLAFNDKWTLFYQKLSPPDWKKNFFQKIFGRFWGTLSNCLKTDEFWNLVKLLRSLFKAVISWICFHFLGLSSLFQFLQGQKVTALVRRNFHKNISF